MSVLSTPLWDTADAEIKGEPNRRRQKRPEKYQSVHIHVIRLIDAIGQRETPVKDRQTDRWETDRHGGRDRDGEGRGGWWRGGGGVPKARER